MVEVVGLVCVCLCGRRCVLCTGVSEFQPDDHRRWKYGSRFIKKLFILNYFHMLQNYCNVSQAYQLIQYVGYLLLKTSYCTF